MRPFELIYRGGACTIHVSRLFYLNDRRPRFAQAPASVAEKEILSIHHDVGACCFEYSLAPLLR